MLKVKTKISWQNLLNVSANFLHTEMINFYCVTERCQKTQKEKGDVMYRLQMELNFSKVKKNLL